MEFRSQLGRVRGLGASHEGVHHFWVQRVTGVALIPVSYTHLTLPTTPYV